MKKIPKNSYYQPNYVRKMHFMRFYLFSPGDLVTCTKERVIQSVLACMPGQVICQLNQYKCKPRLGIIDSFSSSAIFMSRKDGDIRVYGIAVLDLFSCGISLIEIITCCIVVPVSSSVAVCDFSSFGWRYLVKKDASWYCSYCSFELSCLIQVNTLSKTML